jgi:hypothetical protein
MPGNFQTEKKNIVFDPSPHYCNVSHYHPQLSLSLATARILHIPEGVPIKGTFNNRLYDQVIWI